MHKVFIIAEAGVNHNGSLKLAKKLVDVASVAGADAVKFQTFKTENMVSRYASKAVYQKLRTNNVESQFDMLKKLELDVYQHKELIAHCRKKRILFLSSPFDLESIDLLHNLGLKILKIPSGEITNLPYLRKIGRLKKKIILSTGMSHIHEIADALRVLIRAGTKRENIIVMHCNTAYPTPVCDVNLKIMLNIRDRFKVKVGYSDHTLGIEIPMAAVALGAVAVEKHFTLDKDMRGPDHVISLEPDELATMVQGIRHIEMALGDGPKIPTRSEINNKLTVRKSIIAMRHIKKGETFTQENITVKRPGIGISPMDWDIVMGKKAKKDFRADEIIRI